jgi:hypothetical protein
MADPALWASLKDNVLSILKDTAKDIVDVEKPEVVSLLKELAEEGAKQTWLLVNGSDDEKAQAAGNIRSLKAQAIIDAADGIIVASAHLLVAFSKIIETAGNFLIQNGPAILAAIPK